MNITHPPQTDEQKVASIQLNNIGTINALNTHNRELQQKVMMLNAENEELREALSNAAGELRHAYIMGFTERYRDAAIAASSAAAIRGKE